MLRFRCVWCWRWLCVCGGDLVFSVKNSQRRRHWGAFSARVEDHHHTGPKFSEQNNSLSVSCFESQAAQPAPAHHFTSFSPLPCSLYIDSPSPQVSFSQICFCSRWKRGRVDYLHSLDLSRWKRGRVDYLHSLDWTWMRASRCRCPRSQPSRCIP